MTRNKAKLKAKAAISKIIQAANELAEAEKAYYSRKPRASRRQTALRNQ